MRARFAPLLFVSLGACSASSPPRPAAPDPATEAAIALEDDDPDPTPGSPTLRDAAGALSFVKQLCAAAKRQDWAYVKAHAQLPLRGQEQVGTEDKPLKVAGLLGEDKPEQLQYRAVCKYLKETTKELRDFKLEDDEAKGVVALNGHDYRLTIGLDPPRLVEQKLLIPNQPLGDPKLATLLSRLPIVVNVSGRGHETEMESFLSRLVQDELEQRQTCAQLQAAREPVSLSLSIEVRTKPERVPRVDLYASTVADSRFLGCLQTQLVPLLEQTLARPTEAKHYQLWTMIGIVVKGDDADANAVIVSPAE